MMRKVLERVMNVSNAVEERPLKRLCRNLVAVLGEVGACVLEGQDTRDLPTRFQCRMRCARVRL
jgi:hypothetical protein